MSIFSDDDGSDDDNGDVNGDGRDDTVGMPTIIDDVDIDEVDDDDDRNIKTSTNALVDAGHGTRDV